MSAPASTVGSYARSSGQPRRLVLDPWVIGLVAALLLIGLVMVASASIGIADARRPAMRFHYFMRQLRFVRARPGGRGHRPVRSPRGSGTSTRSYLLVGAFAAAARSC